MANDSNKKKLTFTNSVGETFPLLPLNPLEEQMIRDQIAVEWKAAGKQLPEPPSYEAENVAGEKYRIQLKKRSDADTPELKQAWDEFEERSRGFEAEFSQRFMISCFLCVDADPLQFPDWIRRMKARGMPVADDELERLFQFCKSWVIRSSEDIAGLVIACTRTIIAMDGEAQKAAEDLFRSHMETAFTAAVTGDQTR